MCDVIISYALPVCVLVASWVLLYFPKIKAATVGSLDLNVFSFSILGFSYFGLTLGIFTGLSSTPAVSAVLPAILAFIGSMMSYYFFNHGNSVESPNNNQVFAMIALILISIFLSLGAYQGIKQRKIYESNQRIDEINKEITLKKIENELKKNLLQFEKDLRISDTINFDDIPKMTN